RSAWRRRCGGACWSTTRASSWAWDRLDRGGWPGASSRMPAVDFGTFLLMQSPSARTSREIYGRAIEMAQAAERLVFHNIWLAEHHFSTYGYHSRAVQVATYLAALTERIRVSTAVIVVPLHHPLVV